ncbi:hypothetical protein AAHA92_15098 [Salvia divinorum]|uniref:Uncharacterized protein n=1 Tax=Salvia divinorum TaxID=28513 RepID=A0ABD1HDM5_SALDI
MKGEKRNITTTVSLLGQSLPAAILGALYRSSSSSWSCTTRNLIPLLFQLLLESSSLETQASQASVFVVNQALQFQFAFNVRIPYSVAIANQYFPFSSPNTSTFNSQFPPFLILQG